MKMNRILPVILLCLIFQGCEDSNLKKISKSLVVTAKITSEIQTSAINSNSSGLLSTDTTRTILELCNKVNFAGKQATALTRQIESLDDPSKLQIISIISPVILELGNIIAAPTELPSEVRILLLSLQTTLNSIQLIVAGGA